MAASLCVLSVVLAVLSGRTVLAAGDHPGTTRSIMGVEGGTLRSPSQHATFTVPPEALPADTELSITELPAPKPNIGFIYELEPDGLVFEKPATLTVQYSPADLPEGFDPEDVTMLRFAPPPAAEQPDGPPASGNSASSGFEFLETAVSPEAGTVSTELHHLSRYGARFYPSYKLGTDRKELKPVFDYGDRSAHTQGAGRASPHYDLSGWLAANAKVPMGEDGTAVAQAHCTKWFRVKSGVGGKRKDPKASVSIDIAHGAEILDIATNQYNTVYQVTLFDEAGQGVGRPTFYGDPASEFSRVSGPQMALLDGGLFLWPGGVSRTFSLDPHRAPSPQMPPYEPCSPTILFEDCPLASGRYYAIWMQLAVTVFGFPPDPVAGTPAIGGQVDWPMFGFHVERISVASS